MQFRTFLATGAVALSLCAGAVAANEPYVVKGNTHMLIGVTLNEEAVRSMLPEGLEPAEGMTGGMQVYTSGGSEDVAAYKRSYVWVDLASFNSITGNPGRYMLWTVDTEHAEKLTALGLVARTGDVSFEEADGLISGKVTLDGAQVFKGSVVPGDCGAGTGVINYPSLPEGADGLAVIQYAFAGDFCGATLESIEISVPDDHPLAKLAPKPAGWAAVARDLSFSATPAMPLPKKD